MKGAATVFAAAVALMAAPLQARAQSWEVSGLAAVTPSAGLDNQAPELSDLKIASGFTWGIQGARLFGPRWGAEVLWTQQGTVLKVGTDAGSADLFTMTIRQLHGDVVYHVGAPDARLRPFVFGGLGATFLTSDTVASETKFSLDVGGGVKFFLSRSVGARAHFRYKPTFLNDSSSDFCDPFGFCQGVLQQIEFGAAAVLRF